MAMIDQHYGHLFKGADKARPTLPLARKQTQSGLSRGIPVTRNPASILEALFRTRTGDPLLTIERRGGKQGHAREAAGTKIPQTEGIGRKRVTARARACPGWCSLSVPFGSGCSLGYASVRAEVESSSAPARVPCGSRQGSSRGWAPDRREGWDVSF
jgi:hypothetical protein